MPLANNRFAKYVVQQDDTGGSAPAPKPNRFAKYKKAATPAAPVTPKSSYDEMAAVPQRSVVGQAPQWDRQATPDQRMMQMGTSVQDEAAAQMARGFAKMNVPQEQANIGKGLSGAADVIGAWQAGNRSAWKNSSDRDKIEGAANIFNEMTLVPSAGRVADHIGQKTGNTFLQTDAFKTDENYDPRSDLINIGLGGGIGDDIIRGGKAVAKGVATDLKGAFRSGPRGPAPRQPTPTGAPVASPQAPQPSPVAPAQPRPPGAGQMPNAGNAAPVLNAVPAAPVVPKGQIRVAKDTAKILTRIMRSSRIKDADVRGYLPGAVQRYKALNDERVPFAFFLESDLPNHFPQPIADEVTTKLRTWGRERNSATGPQDTSRRTIQETTQTLRSGQQDYLSGVMDNNLYKGKLIGKEDQFKGEIEANGRVAYNTAIKNANDSLISGRATVEQRDAVGRIQELLHNPAFLKNVPEHLRVKALRDKIDIEDYVQKDPIAAAHWLQSELRQAVSAAEGVGGVATSESRLYGEMRDGLLKELEKFNGYKGARKAHGDIYGAVEAINFGDSFFRAARSEVETARLAREFKALSKRQKTAATMSIRDALKNEFRNKAEDTAAKVTRLQQAGVLDALETVLGADGKRVSDAIRNVVKQNDQLKAIDQGSGSPTFNNMRGADAARDMVQSPVNKAIGAFGDKTSWPMTVAGDVVLASSGLPPVLTAGKAATALVDRFGNPSAKTMSRATEGLYGLPKAPQNALAPPPRTPRVGGPRAPKAPPTQQTLDDLLAQYDAIDHRAEPGKAASVLKKIETLKKQLESGTSGPALLGSSKKPKPQKMGFGGGSKQLDMSEPARMQRAREMGFDVDTPLYHGTAKADFDSFDPNAVPQSKKPTGGGFNDRGVFLTQQPKVASQYAEMASREIGGGEVMPVYVRGKLLAMPRPLYNRLQDAMGVVRSGGTLSEVKRVFLEDDLAALGVKWDAQKEHAIDAIKRSGFDGIRVPYDSRSGHQPAGEVMVFDPANIRRTDAAFDPSQSGSSKLLSGFTGAPEALGAGAGAVLAPDANGDGTVDGAERFGGMVTGLGIVGAARYGRGKFARKGPPAPKGSYGSRPSAMGDLVGHQAAQRQLRELEDYRKTAPPSEHAAVDQEIADLRGFLQGETPIAKNGFGQFGRQIGPPRPPGMKAPQTAPTKVKKGPRNITVSPEIAEQMKVVRKANADERKAMKKNVMRPDRDELNAPWTEARIAEEDKLAQMQAKERARRVGRVARRQTFQRIAKHPTTSILAGGAALGAGYAGLKTAFPDKQDEPEDTSRPGYWFDRVATQDKETASKMQLALHQWGVWPTEMRTLRNGFKQKEPVEMTGRWGRVSKDAFKRWLYEIDPTRDPEDPITPEDVERLLAGPKGYQDDDGHWQNPRDRKPIAAR